MIMSPYNNTVSTNDFGCKTWTCNVDDKWIAVMKCFTN